jgi:hypothetical protein
MMGEGKSNNHAAFASIPLGALMQKYKKGESENAT